MLTNIINNARVTLHTITFTLFVLKYKP